MSKKDKYNFTKMENVDKHYQGIGYHIPKGYTKQQVIDLYKLWNKKLQNSGHVDLEYFSQSSPGLSSPFFCEARTQGIYKQENYSLAEYYSLMQSYLNLYMSTDESKKRYKHNHTTYKLMLESYIQGTTFLGLAKMLRDRSSYRGRVHINTATRAYKRNKNRTKFWTYISIRRLLNHCWLWHCFDINGELTPQQLQHFDFLGLDVPGTQDVINSELLKLGLEPITLRAKTVRLFVRDNCEPVHLID